MQKQVVIKQEQGHFDRAYDAREASRSVLLQAGDAAGGPNKGRALVRKKGEEAARALGDPESAVAFGRFDLDGETFYVGNHGITDDAKDLLVLNWRADFAQKYYQASAQDPLGVALRRDFTTDGNEVRDFADIVFAEMAARIAEITDEERWGVNDALLRDLDRGRTGEMADIVRTIHQTQDSIIRRPLEGVLVVQGGPGTGKTAVALHRVSWLLYNEADLPPEEVLVIGPNRTFTRYISKVLPALGDASVNHQDLRSLGPVRSSGRTEPRELARLKGDAKMADLLVRALRQRVGLGRRSDVLSVGNDVRLRFTRDELAPVLSRGLERMTYTAGRLAVRDWLASRVEAVTRAPAPAALIDQAVERVWPSHTPQSFLRELLGSRDRLLDAAGDDFTASQVQLLMRQPSEKISEEKWTDADVALLDELHRVINGATTTYRHIVIDEAQDLSPMQLRSVRRRSSAGSYTVVGDLAQGTGPSAIGSWDAVLEALGADEHDEVIELGLGYRVPKQIYDFAAPLLSKAAPELTPPRVIREGPTDPELIEAESWFLTQRAVSAAQLHAGKGRFVGVIVPEELREELEGELREDGTSFADVRDGELSASINVMTPEQSKGLEFDAVVVVDPERVAQMEHGHRLLYVAMTRATQHLTVVHSGSPLGMAGEDMPIVEVPTISTGDPAPSNHAEVREPDVVARTESVDPAPGVRLGRPVHEEDFDPLSVEMAKAIAAKIEASLAQTVTPGLRPLVLKYVVEAMEGADQW
ncbi:HelD family protein [Janibacter melonis]|uniref:HelD family protein n=1 Tax=Janibacter melonis TaxID=262209 RepID=UPI00174EB19B|nr:ATP-binding domain-containing protein [Janibacter melonis]